MFLLLSVTMGKIYMLSSLIVPEFYAARGITSAQWCSWQWQLASVARKVTTVREQLTGYWARQLAHLEEAEHSAWGDVRLTPYVLSLIKCDDPNDPIALQHFPRLAEVAASELVYDEVWERLEDFGDGENRMVQQKYPDIVLLRIANTCHSFCRFCFEKERTLLKSVPTLTGPERLLFALEYIKQRPRVRQVLLSGGDPLIMPDTVFFPYLEALSNVPQLRTLRINTRSFLHNPFRITPEFVARIASIQTASWIERERGISIELGVHFNHPQEITSTALEALRRCARAGITLYNQTVLLKGINDQVEILANLFRLLRAEGVSLHYLSEAMAVPGTEHFRTSVRSGQELMRGLRRLQEFRGQLPYFELSHHTGKQIIPDTMNEFFYEDTQIVHRKKQRIIRFLSDITGKWEIFPDGA